MCIAGRVIKQTSAKNYVLAVTSVDDELFLLLHQNDNQVAVYSINDYQLLRYIDLPVFKPTVHSDMTSCVRHKCLCASDADSKCIHRYELSKPSGVCAIMKRITTRTTSKWSVSGSPRGLSVIPGSCNLLVTCLVLQYYKLVELRADSGQPVREIALQLDINSLHHAAQLTTGQYVVCHGIGYKSLNRVCIVDVEGRVTYSYGGRCGSDVGQLYWPCHLAVDEKSQFIFVADYRNDRVVLLSPTLEFVREFTEGVTASRRLYFHQTT